MDKNYARPRVPLRTSQLHIDEKAADPTYWVTGSRQHPGVSLLSSLSRPCLRSESQSEDGISHRVHHTRASAAGQPGQTVRAPRTACASTRVGTARSVTAWRPPATQAMHLYQRSGTSQAEGAGKNALLCTPGQSLGTTGMGYQCCGLSSAVTCEVTTQYVL